MSSNLFRASIFITGAFFLFVMGTSVSQAARHVPTVCEGQSGKAFGLCRAAVASGCATASEGINLRGRSHGHSRRHGHRHHSHSRRSNTGSRYCSRLGRNFTRLTGLDPVWIVPENNEPETPTRTEETETTETTTTETTTDTTTTTRTDTRTSTTGS